MRISDWSSDVCSSDLCRRACRSLQRGRHDMRHADDVLQASTRARAWPARRAGCAVAPLIGGKLRQAFSDLEADTDLKMPATRAGWLGIVSGLCFAVAVAILAFTTLAPPLRIFAAGASAYAGLWLRHLDRRRLPRRCDTIGDLEIGRANV